MRIRVRSGERSFSLVLPTRFVFSKTLINLGIRMGKRYSDHVPDLPPEAVNALCDEIGRIKKEYGAWDLVEVLSSDGEAVKITL